MFASLTLLVSSMAVGQTPDARAQFEVASIRPSAAGSPDHLNVGVHIDGALLRCTSLSLSDYIGMAYGVKYFQIIGPGWLNEAKFDIAATLPAGVARKRVLEMIQSLLEDRFKMALHRESKEFPVYAIVLGKGPLNLKKSPEDGETGAAPADSVNVTVSGGGRSGAVADLGGGSSISSANGRLEGKRVTLRQMADQISGYMDRPVVDMTGLQGTYDIAVQYSLDELRNMLKANGVYRPIPDSAADGFPGSLMDSFQALGLKLESRKAPLEILVIDRIEKTPTQN